MPFSIIYLNKSIVLLVFSDSHTMGMTFVRFQEHYESPKFKGEIFTLDEFKAWYSETYGYGSFTYCDDWGGFNIPSHILKPFYAGDFDPLSELEKSLLNTFKDRQNERLYIIASPDNGRWQRRTIEHETAHGLFYIDSSYKEEALCILNKYNTTATEKYLLKKGYCDDTLQDEVHAYGVHGNMGLGVPADEEMVKELCQLFDQAKKTNNVIFPWERPK